MSTDWREGKKPVILITGYLGSGKTTLMQHLLSQEQRKLSGSLRVALMFE